MAHKKPDIGLVGLGNFGKKIARKLLEEGKLKIVCKRTINEENQSYAQQNGFQITDNYHNLLNDKDVNWIFIATPVNTHHKLLKAAILSNKNIFCEKPITENTNEAEELVRLATKKGVDLYVDDVFRHRECFVKLKEFLKGENVQKISFSWQKYGTFGDTLWNNLVYHDLYLILNLLSTFSINKVVTEKTEKDKLKFEIITNGPKILFNYDRTVKNNNLKSLEIDTHGKSYSWSNDKIYLNQEIIFQENPRNDALTKMIQELINKRVNFELNNRQALEVLKIIESLQKIP
jgi:predicted dehydrogenase